MVISTFADQSLFDAITEALGPPWEGIGRDRPRKDNDAFFDSRLYAALAAGEIEVEVTRRGSSGGLSDGVTLRLPPVFWREAAFRIIHDLGVPPLFSEQIANHGPWADRWIDFADPIVRAPTPDHDVSIGHEEKPTKRRYGAFANEILPALFKRHHAELAALTYPEERARRLAQLANCSQGTAREFLKVPGNEL